MARPHSDRHGTHRLIVSSAALISLSLATGCGGDRDRPAEVYPGPPLARIDMALNPPASRPATGPKLQVDSSRALAVAAPTTKPVVPAPRPAASASVTIASPPQRRTTPVQLVVPADPEPALGILATMPVAPVDPSEREVMPVLISQPAPGSAEPGIALVPATQVAIREAEPAIAALPDAAPSLAAIAASGTNDSPAFVSQVSDSIRAAYIAQIDASAPEQRLAVRSGDKMLGAVQFQVSGQQVSVHIGQVLDLFAAQIEPALFAQLRQSAAADEFVTLDRIRSAGIPLDYNAAYDELVLGPDRG